MIKIDCFLVTYDRLYDKAIEQLTNQELESITCYEIQKKVEKNISSLVKKNVKEWELPWNSFDYQTRQYYEYGTMVHLLKNEYLIKNSTHIGLFHYDIVFNVNSINQVKENLEVIPDTIFYQKLRNKEDLYLTEYEMAKICEFMNEKLKMEIKYENILSSGWISEALSITPKSVFIKFANFILENKEEIENILIRNRWGIMNNIKHRICGIIERMWGFYLVSCDLPLKQMNVIHDWNSYTHKHFTDKDWIQK
jgi:hypothetical protein